MLGCSIPLGARHSPLFGAHIPLHRQLHMGRATCPAQLQGSGGEDEVRCPQNPCPCGATPSAPHSGRQGWPPPPHITPAMETQGRGPSAWGEGWPPLRPPPLTLWPATGTPLAIHGDNTTMQRDTMTSHRDIVTSHGDTTAPLGSVWISWEQSCPCSALTCRWQGGREGGGPVGTGRCRGLSPRPDGCGRGLLCPAR